MCVRFVECMLMLEESGILLKETAVPVSRCCAGSCVVVIRKTNKKPVRIGGLRNENRILDLPNQKRDV